MAEPPTPGAPVPDAWERIRRASSRSVADVEFDASVVHLIDNDGPRHAVPVDWSRTFRGLIVVTALAIVIAGYFFWRAAPQEIDEGATSASASDSLLALGTTSAPAGQESSAAPAVRVVVHVVGAVRRPGVVELTPGSRVADAIAAAGGLRPGVDAASVNLARAVSDGEQVVVGPQAAGGTAPGPAAAAGSGGARGGSPDRTDGRLDLNAATADQLEELDGVGPVLAGRIVAWREANGRFGSVDDLQQVSGIGPKTFERLRDQVIA